MIKHLAVKDLPGKKGNLRNLLGNQGNIGNIGNNIFSNMI